MQIEFKFYRHATSELYLGETRILIDPMYMKKSSRTPLPSLINLRRNPQTEFPGEFPRLSIDDIVLLTHHHFDHFDSKAAGNLPKSVSIITPKNGLIRLKKLNFRNIHPVSVGQKIIIRDITVTAIPVKHAERFGRLLYKIGVGYLIKSKGMTIYISGDTIFCDDIVESLRGITIDLAILYGGCAKLPLWGRHTLSARDIISLANMLNLKNVIVTHVGSLNHCTENFDELRLALSNSSLPGKYYLPQNGDIMYF